MGLSGFRVEEFSVQRPRGMSEGAGFELHSLKGSIYAESCKVQALKPRPRRDRQAHESEDAVFELSVFGLQPHQKQDGGLPK